MFAISRSLVGNTLQTHAYKRLGGNCTLSSNFKALPLFQSKSLRQSVTLQMSPIYGVPRNVTQMKCPMRCPHEQKLEPRLALQAR